MPEDAPLRFRRPPGLEFSTFASWADLSRTIAPLYATAGTIKDGGTLAAEIDRIAARTSDPRARADAALRVRSEEPTSELQSLMRISYAVFCLKKKTHKQHTY